MQSKFFCWFYKESSKSIFTVDISSSKSVVELKEAIQMKQQSLSHVDLTTFHLYELSFRPGKDSDEILQQWRIQEHPPINPMSSVSTLDSSKSLIVIPLMTLNCWVSSNLSFPIKISPEETVSALRIVIQCLKPRLCDVDADDIRFYKAPDVSAVELEFHPRTLKPSEGQAPLMGVNPLYHYFPEYPPKEQRIHILVDIPPPHLVPQKRPLEDLPHPDKYLFTAMTPSMMEHRNYRKLQQNHDQRILDRRFPPSYDSPRPDDDVPPIALVYRPFGEFLDIFLSKGDLGGEIFIHTRDHVHSFAAVMAQVYRSEERREAGLEALNNIFGAALGHRTLRLRAASIGAFRYDGFDTGQQGEPICMVEFKNEQECSCIPIAELLRYYHELVQRVWVKNFATIKFSKLPALGVTIVGPEITFYAIAYLERWHYTPLTPAISCVDGAVGGHAREQLHRAFVAACTLLRSIINDVSSPSLQPIDNRNFPYVTKLPSYGDSLGPATINFRITGKVSGFPYQQVYHATSADHRPLIVKFTSKYSPELHKFCADRNCAPVLRGFARLPGNIFGVAMDLVEDATHLHPSSTNEKEQWRKQLADLVKEFHAADFVHGDLRFPNIVCDAKNNIMLLDYDWGGKEGEASFPLGPLNPELTAGWEGRTNLRITKDDDKQVLAQTLARIQYYS